MVIVRLSRISTTDIGKFGFIQHIVTKIQNYEKIKVRYDTFNYEVSMKYPINYHLFKCNEAISQDKSLTIKPPA